MPFHTRVVFIFLCAVLLAVSIHQQPASADPMAIVDEELRQLLEKSLSITEIDKEISRIGEQKAALSQAVELLTKQISSSEAELSHVQEQAGRVIRSYYTGERDLLFSALFSFQSLDSFFAILDYVGIIMSSDRETLHTYKAKYTKLQTERGEKLEEEERLTMLEEQLLLQRERIVMLQTEVDLTINSSADPELMKRLIQEVVLYWESAGMNEVKRYFRALAEAMNHLPAWLNKNKNLLEISGLSYTIRLPEDELNRFLREQNELFHSFAFTFQDNKISAHGRREGMSVDLVGSYVLEDEPKNAIRFYTESLRFNGLELPDTTRNALGKEFDLGFYPQMLVPFIKAKAVAIEDGELVVTLRVEF